MGKEKKATCGKGFKCEECGNTCCLDCTLRNSKSCKLGGCPVLGFKDKVCSHRIYSEENTFTKADLRNGDTVILRNGEELLLLKNFVDGYDIMTVKPQIDCDYIKVINYNDDLTRPSFPGMDIVTVLRPTDFVSSLQKTVKIVKGELQCKYKSSQFESVYQREAPVKEIPSSEAFEVLKKHYGCDVKIVDK